MANREIINRGTGPDSRILSALDRLHAGRQHDRDGRLDEAVDCYQGAHGPERPAGHRGRSAPPARRGTPAPGAR